MRNPEWRSSRIIARSLGPKVPHDFSLSAAASARSSSTSSNGNVGLRVTLGGLMAFAGFRSIHSLSSQNRRKPRRYSRRLTDDVAANLPQRINVQVAKPLEALRLAIGKQFAL